MSEISRRAVAGLGLGLGAAAVGALTGCGPHRPAHVLMRQYRGATPGAARAGLRTPRLIGDGSTADTGPQPRQPHPPAVLEAGQSPPQFVVFSWDGAGEVGTGLFSRFLQLARDHDARMTFFLSGLYLLPESLRHLYRPPNNPVGASDIAYLTDAHLRQTLRLVRQAWLDGHEIGTHFNGHFCTGPGSVAYWTPEQWHSEIQQVQRFVGNWRTHTGWHTEQPLPFDYAHELIGGRTPCLLGQENLLPVARALGWRYDASSPGGLQRWPVRRQGVWDLPLQQIPFPGHTFEVLSMDYNILANQSRNSTDAPPYQYAAWRAQAVESYLAGFARAYHTNRAPFFIGNHFEGWNGGIYMDAAEETLKRIASLQDVRVVSFRQLVDWLDAQNPAVLARLRSLDVGERPVEGWSAFLSQPSAARSGRRFARRVPLVGRGTLAGS